MIPDYRFPRSRRLLKTAEFDRVFARRRSAADATLLLYACENNLPHARLGLVVSRKCGGAVARARWKRCLREAFRLSQGELPAGLDVVALPRPSAQPTTPAVQQSLLSLSRRLAERLRLPPPPSEAPP